MSASDGLPPVSEHPAPFGPEFTAVMRDRERETDEFYADLARPGSTPEENRVMRQAFAGMLWGMEYYAYNVARWLDGDPGQPTPTPSHLSGRNSRWRHVDAADILPSRCTRGPHQLEDGVGAVSSPPSSSPQWPRRITSRSTHPTGIGTNHWAIRNSITAAVSCSVNPDPATLDRIPM